VRSSYHADKQHAGESVR